MAYIRVEFTEYGLQYMQENKDINIATGKWNNTGRMLCHIVPDCLLDRSDPSTRLFTAVAFDHLPDDDEEASIFGGAPGEAEGDE